MLKTTKQALPAILVIMSMVLALVPTGFALASDADFTLTSVMQAAEPVTYYVTDSAQISSLDPARATDEVSITAIENLFLGLTDSDPTTPGNINPELATSWETSEDGLTWTFHLRDDVPWVRWDPVSDEGEVLRNVTAQDFVYGMQRACDPRIADLYGAVAASVIAGCGDMHSKDISEVTDADYDLVQVEALDDTTLAVNLLFPAGFFFSMTTMWMLRPVPQEIIQEFGDDWTELGNLTTNGPFVLDEWVRGVRRVYMTNPYIPEDLRGPGNVERVVVTIVEDAGTTLALYQDNQVDRSGVPAAEVQSILSDPEYQDQLSQVSDLVVYYFAFGYDKEPFGDVHARRAFSASVDRNAFIQEIVQGRGVPMIHLTPPGMVGAPPINEVGVGYDPEYAKAEIEAAGYPNCEGFPNIEIVTYQGAGTWAEFLAASVERELGCDPSVFTIEEQEFSVLLESTDPDTPTEDRPNLWTLGWGPDYPDANNWVFDAGLLACEAENSVKRPCTEIDDLIAQAAEESDQAVRAELYYRIEEMAFGPEGEYPILPLYMRTVYQLTKPWVTGPLDTDGVIGGAHYDWRTIDQAAQLEARSAS